MTQRQALAPLRAGLVLAFVMCLLIPQPSMFAPPETSLGVQGLAALASPAPLTREQANLVDYLSDKYKTSSALVERIVRAAYKYAAQSNLSPMLVLAIIEKESSLKPDAKSGYGAIGLMQVVPRYHAEKLPGDTHAEHLASLKHPETNIRVGTQIVAEYVAEQGGSLERGLRKYSGNASAYLKKVLRFRRELEQQAQGV